MLMKILDIFPEFLLLVGIIHLWGLWLITKDADKSYARVARFWLLISLFFNIVFYARVSIPSYLENNASTLLFKLPVYFFMYIILGVSPTWFAAEKKTGVLYYIGLLAVLVVMNIMQGAINLLLLAVCVMVLNIISYYLQKVETTPTKTCLWGYGLIIMLFFVGSIISLFLLTNGELNYQQLAKFFTDKKDNLAIYLSVVGLIIPFLSSLGIAPFHFDAEDRTGKSILPVSHYFAVAYPLIWASVFIKLNILVLEPFAIYLKPIYVVFALLSMVLGAVGANARINLHRVYAFGSMYHFGVFLLLLSFFSSAAYFSAYSYIVLYVLGLNGAYLVFYHLKSRSEYVSTLESLAGIMEYKPYTTSILLISLFSLIGLPPLAGFLAQTDVIYQLINLGHPMYLIIVFFCLLLLVKIYFEIIKTAYFEQNMMMHDAENKFICLFMALNALCILTAAFNPFNWLEKFKDMFYVLFI